MATRQVRSLQRYTHPFIVTSDGGSWEGSSRHSPKSPSDFQATTQADQESNASSASQSYSGDWRQTVGLVIHRDKADACLPHCRLPWCGRTHCDMAEIVADPDAYALLIVQQWLHEHGYTRGKLCQWYVLSWYEAHRFIFHMHLHTLSPGGARKRGWP